MLDLILYVGTLGGIGIGVHLIDMYSLSLDARRSENILGMSVTQWEYDDIVVQRPRGVHKLRGRNWKTYSSKIREAMPPEKYKQTKAFGIRI